MRSVAHYERCIFGPTAWPKIKKGQFIEDTVGQRQRKLITEGGLEAHREWGTFLLWPRAEGAAEEDAAGSFVMTHHLDGIGYKTVAERARLGLTVYDGEVTKVQEAGALAGAAHGGELRAVGPSVNPGLVGRPLGACVVHSVAVAGAAVCCGKVPSVLER